MMARPKGIGWRPDTAVAGTGSHGPGITLWGSMAETNTRISIGDNRPTGTVHVWRLDRRRRWTLMRKVPGVEVKALRTIARGPAELLQFVPVAGRGGPMVVASPDLLTAWHKSPPLR